MEAWRETGGDIPDETAALVEQCGESRAASRCRWRSAQSRRGSRSTQMEGLLFERSEVVADLHSMEMVDHYHQSHVTLTTFLRDRLEKAATAAEAEEALRAGTTSPRRSAAEAKRAREEKAKAKRAEVRQRAKHLRERELEEAKAAEEAAHAEEARPRGVRGAARANARRALAAKAEAEAEAEAEFARRRALELEAKVREANDDEMIEAAKRASLAANDARRARDAAAEKAAIDARARARRRRVAANPRRRRRWKRNGRRKPSPRRKPRGTNDA